MKQFDDNWKIAHATPGRAVLTPLPETISEEQIDWFRANLPRTCKIVRPGEPIGNTARVEDTDHQLDVLRSLTTEITEKKIELLQAEQTLSKLKLELERTKFILEERKKHARSLGSALTDLVETLGGNLKL